MLEVSQKESLLEMENAKDNKNKYTRSLTYSEDGVLNGSKTAMTRDGRTAAEEEIYDDRGIMIFDVADIVSRTKTVNIDGTVVKCTAEFEGHDIEDSYYIGQAEKLSIDSEGGGPIIEDKPDVEKEVHSTESGLPTQINKFENPGYRMMYAVNGEIYGNTQLDKIPVENREAVARAFIMMGYNTATGEMEPSGMEAMRIEIVNKALVMEQTVEEDFEEIIGNNNEDEEEQ